MEDVEVLPPSRSSSSESIEKPPSLSALVFERSLNESDGFQSPILRTFTRNIVKKWRSSKERAINKRLREVKTEKKRREAESKEVARLITRTVPLDLLAKEWMDNNDITVDVRIYLVEKLLPTLILGIEKLLNEVSDRNLAASEGFCTDFNPINTLAQYLMRNNPKYSNLLESSPYAKGLKKVVDDLKKEIYSTEENQLAKIKAEARQKREERELIERKKDAEDRRRSYGIEEQFPEWTSDWKGFIPLAVVQNTLLSFQELVSSMSEEMKKGADFCIPLEPTDTSGNMLDLDGYKQFMKPYAGNISREAFDVFLGHLSMCAKEYRAASLRQTIQLMLQNLFMSLDVNRVGQLDRQRLLELFGVFYDKAVPVDKALLRNPREWPVIEIEEASLEEETEEEEESVFSDEQQQKTTEKPQDEEQPEQSEKEPKEEEEKKDDDEVKKEEKPENGEKKSEEEQTNPEEQQEDKQKDTSEEQQNEEVKDGDDKDEKKEQQSQEEKPSETEDAETEENGTPKEENSEAALSEEEKKLLDAIPDEFESSEDSESKVTGSVVYKPDTQSVVEGSAFDENSLNQSQFIHLTEKFLGDAPKKQLLENLVRFVRSHYIELDFDRLDRINKARKDAFSAKKRRLIDQLFDLWDIDASGFLELEKIQVVLNKWTTDNDPYPTVYSAISAIRAKMDRQEFRDCINRMFIELEAEDDEFESLIKFLMTSVERSFEERRRSETRKRWLGAIDVAAQTSGANLEPVYNTVFQILYKDAEEHGRNKQISAFVSMLENNNDPETISRGDTVLRYVACTQEDIGFMLGKVLYRNMKAVSWAAVDTGKPIHVPKVGSHGGVYFWNPVRKPESTEGSFIVLPTKDHEKRVIGILGIDTLNDPHKTSFITHEITFYQGAAKALGQAIQFIDVRKKTLRVAESAVNWILRRSQNVQNVNVYMVEPGLRPADGMVVRRMMVLGHNGFKQKFNNPPRLDRKDNLFRDYLFKCIESSETITADAYGERHMAFPLRDAEGHAVAVVDISIGTLKALPTHENKEIQRMLRLLAMAHREVAREVAGIEKNIVLEVEKEFESARIDVLFDRLMLLDLRENVGRLDARAFAEIKSYKDPPKVIHDILKAVLGIFNTNLELQAKFEEWTTCKQYINQDLVKNITSYDPTARENVVKVDARTLARILQDVPQGAVAKHGSLPAQYLFNWAFVCLSLIEHTDKMTETRPGKVVSPHATSSLMVDHGKGRRDSPTETINTTTKTGNTIGD